MTSKETLERMTEERKKTVEDVMHKYLGVSIKELNDDITARLNEPFIDFDATLRTSFRDAKREFIRRYVIRVLNKHAGNITAAAKEAGISRRSMHRFINEFAIDTQSMRSQLVKEKYSELYIGEIIEDSLRRYEHIIHPEKLSIIYQNVSELSKGIIERLADDAFMTLHQAELEFERRFLGDVMREHHGSVTKAAAELGIRYETLHRKLKYVKEYFSK